MRYLNVYNNMAEHDTDDGRASDNTVSFIRDINKVIYNPIYVIEEYNPTEWDGTFADPEVGRILYSKGLIANQGYSSKEELALITDLGESFTDNELIETFEEFKYFTGVSELDATCFNNCTSLTKIHIPDSVIVLEPNAFSNCVALTHLVIGNGITEITGTHFKESKQLEYLEIGTGMERFLNSAFSNYTKLETLMFNDGENPLVIKYSFNGCSSLKSVVLPKNTVEISSSSFQYCSELETLIFHDGENPLVIKQNSFNDCSSLKSVILPKNTVEISSAFRYCSELEYLDIQSSMESGVIDSGAFSNCNKLKTLIIGNGITMIDDYGSSFSSLPLLSSVTILGGENKNVIIGSNTFSNLPALTKMTIPNTIEKIQYSSFSRLENLTELVFENGDSNTVIESSSFQQLAKLERLVIGSSVKSIASYMFNDLPNLTELVFENGDSPIEIPYTSFSRLPNVKTIHLSNRIHEIGAYSFTRLPLLSSYIVDATNPAFSAEDGVLYDKDKTKIITYPSNKSAVEFIIPNTVIEILDDVFVNVIINSFVVDATNPAFSAEDGVLYNKDKTKIIAYPSNKSDVEFIIPNTVVDITPGIFISNNLLKLTIPESVTSLPNNCFYNCSNLTEIIIPESVTSLPNNCFYNCSNLTEIIIPDSVTSFGYSCFGDCSNLTEIIIPDSVTSIGGYCFHYCTSLQAISVLNLIPPTIGNGAFAAVPGDFYVYVPDESVDAYKTASGWNEFVDRIFPIISDLDIINISDPEVRRILTNDFELPIQGEGFYRGDIQSITDLGESFADNELIETFEEFKYFTGVTEIESGTFSNCTSLTSIDIPAGVTSLGDSCFNGCSSLTSIDIPESIISLGEHCFGSCSSLILATVLPAIPPSLGEEVFEGAHISFNIYVPDESVYAYKTASGWVGYADKIYPMSDAPWDGRFADPEVGRVLFAAELIADPLTSTVEELGLITSLDSTFRNNKVLTKFPELKYCTKVTNMERTFDGCSSLVEAPIIPESVIDMGAAFYRCSSLVSASDIPEGTVVMTQLFRECTNLIEAPRILSKSPIWNQLFTLCSSLVSAPIIPEGVTTLNALFHGCTSLLEAPEIPSTVTSMHETFYNCPSLNGVFVLRPTTPPTYSSDLVGANVVSIYVPDKSVDAYKTASGWVDYADKIYPLSTKPWPGLFEDPEVGRVLKSEGLIANETHSTKDELSQITSLGSAFKDNKVITKFPELEYCTKLTNLAETFSGCTSLVDAPIIPESITDMTNTFSGCTSLVDAPIIPESITDMTNTFSGCTSLVDAPIIPESVTSMNQTFNGCVEINGIYMIKSLTPPFYSSSLMNVVSIYVPDSSVEAYKTASGWINYADKIYPISTKPWSGPFEDPEVGRVLHSKGLIANESHSTEDELSQITSLSSAFLNNSVLTKFPELKYCTEVIAMDYTFYGCSNLVEAPSIPESVTNMNFTFQNCSSLVNAPIIPESITSLRYTFSGCTSLVDAPIIHESITDMTNTFSGCSKLSGIYVIKPLTPPSYADSLTNVVEIYVPDESVAAYKPESGWINHANKIYPISTKPE